jgi:hypothetical protein
VETRVSRKLGEVRLGFSQTLAHEFDSNWTGTGGQRADRISEGSAEASLFSVPLRFAMRETGYADGQRGVDLRLTQTFMLGSDAMLSHTLTHGVDGKGRGDNNGDLYFYRTLGSVRASAEFTYAMAPAMTPTSAMIGLEKSLDRSWSLYAYGQQPLPTGAAHLDIGAARDLWGFKAGLFGGGTVDGTAYVGLRLWVPLSPAPLDHRWLGF